MYVYIYIHTYMYMYIYIQTMGSELKSRILGQRLVSPGKNVKRLELGLFFSPLGKELQPKSFF